MNVAQQLKLEGQSTAWANEKQRWRDEAMSLLEQFAGTRPEFNADEFRTFAKERGLGIPHHVNVWGSLFTAAARKKWIANSGRYSTSSTPASHAHHLIIWDSKIYVSRQSQ